MMRSIGTDPSATYTDISTYEKSNQVLQQCLEAVLRTDDPREGLNEMLGRLGNSARCHRTYIFELDKDQLLNNTYEWCAEGISSQKDLLQKFKLSEAKQWFDHFEKNETVLIRNLELIRNSDPLLYTALKPLGIHNLLAGRIYNDGILGFVGIDNVDPARISVVEPVISHIGKIAATQLGRIEIRRQLAEMDLRDPETQLYNQKAMYRHAAYDQSARTMAVIYGRMEKPLEDLGQRSLKGTLEKLTDLLETGRIYRISPTEFAAVYVNVREDRINNLRRKVKFSDECINYKVMIGSAWTADMPMFDNLLHEAKRWSYLCGDDTQNPLQDLQPLYRYIEKNHFDLGFLLDAMTIENESGYFFFGDILNNVYYVSDNMARKFGLTGNILQDLPQFWTSRITGQTARNRFESEIQTAKDQHLDRLDIYHQVITTEGHKDWVRCFAMVKWNKEKTQPLFCAGRMTMQDVSLIVDYATNFNWETALCRNLSKIREEGKSVRIIGFSLNDIAKVNNMQGRAFGDNLIRTISEALASQMSDRLAFYKLSGMRCAALIRKEHEEDFEKLIQEMRRLIEEKYHNYGIEVPNPCSFTILDFPRENVGTLDFMEDLNNSIKLSQQEISVAYLDGRKLDIRKIQQSANMALELGRDVLNQMSNFRLMIQPVVSSKTGEIIAGEALLRWRNEGRNVSPGLFIPILEHENMINPVGKWVFEESVKICRRIVSFQKDFHLSVNVSLHQLDDEDFLPFIRDTLKKYDLEGRHIFMEITESCMDKEQEKLMHFVNFCQTLGIKVALDDFGTGYSSIRVLMQYPTAIIKLDRSLLLEMGKSADKQNFISSIVFACHQFGKQVCIEGVETEEQCQMVKKADCDMIQGFYYYRPMEVDEVLTMLAKKVPLSLDPIL